MKNSELKTFLYYNFVLFIILLSGFRDTSIGIDTKYGYFEYFKAIAQGYDLFYLEQGWVLLNKLSIYLGLGYQGVLFFATLLSIVPVILVLHYENIDRFFGLFIYYGMYLYLHSFNMIRQCIAMSFCLLAFFFLLKRKRFLFLFYVIIAFLFHKSAVIFLAFLFIYKRPFHFTACLCLCALSYLFGVFASRRLFIWLAGPYAGYLEGSDFGFRESNAALKLLALLVNVFFLFYLWLCRKQQLTSNPWTKLLLLGTCCMNATQGLELGTRLMFYFTQAQIVYYPYYFQQKKHDKGVLLFVFVMYLFVNFSKILIGQWDSIVPYKSVLLL